MDFSSVRQLAKEKYTWVGREYLFNSAKGKTSINETVTFLKKNIFLGVTPFTIVWYQNRQCYYTNNTSQEKKAYPPYNYRLVNFI
jgi:hypothetical protein